MHIVCPASVEPILHPLCPANAWLVLGACQCAHAVVEPRLSCADACRSCLRLYIAPRQPSLAVAIICKPTLIAFLPIPTSPANFVKRAFVATSHALSGVGQQRGQRYMLFAWTSAGVGQHNDIALACTHSLDWRFVKVPGSEITRMAASAETAAVGTLGGVVAMFRVCAAPGLDHLSLIAAPQSLPAKDPAESMRWTKWLSSREAKH
eukprot:scaffold67762_cov22-Tisochrysis_lutea.AAC.2